MASARAVANRTTRRERVRAGPQGAVRGGHLERAAVPRPGPSRRRGPHRHHHRRRALGLHLRRRGHPRASCTSGRCIGVQSARRLRRGAPAARPVGEPSLAARAVRQWSDGARPRARRRPAAADRRWLLGRARAWSSRSWSARSSPGCWPTRSRCSPTPGTCSPTPPRCCSPCVASRLAERPARGAYTYGFARVDALSGQANGITLLLLAVWFIVEGIRRLIDPSRVARRRGRRASRSIGVASTCSPPGWPAGPTARSLNVRGVLAHLVTDIWAFAATSRPGS